MTVDAVSNINAAGSAATSRTTLAQNFDTFLTLLTAQLQNQDPLEPVDSNQFTEQLVQFSQVEQQIATNDTLTDLVSLQKAAATSALGAYLGRDAEILSDRLTYEGDPVSWGYEAPEGATAVTLRVRDGAGRTVLERSGEIAAGDHTFAWDGRTRTGAEAASGKYRLEVEARDTGGDRLDADVFVRQRVTGIDLAASDPQVYTEDGAIPVSSVRRIYE